MHTCIHSHLSTLVLNTLITITFICHPLTLVNQDGKDFNWQLELSNSVLLSCTAFKYNSMTTYTRI